MNIEIGHYIFFEIKQASVNEESKIYLRVNVAKFRL